LLLLALTRALHNTRLDFDRSPEKIASVEFGHCALSELFRRQVHEAVGWVAAGEGVD
jgi:3-hydroxy-3-methylglutaryl CoA synthase